MRKARNYLNRNFKRGRSNDSLSEKKRSLLMSKIRSKETKFEQNFILLLKKSIRKKFHTNVNLIKGKPDLVFKRDKVCIFLDSDFWHGWQYPRWKHLLKNDFWRNKIENNRKRDLKNTIYLKNKGWIVFRFWEHQIKQNSDKVINKIKNNLN